MSFPTPWTLRAGCRSPRWWHRQKRSDIKLQLVAVGREHLRVRLAFVQAHVTTGAPAVAQSGKFLATMGRAEQRLQQHERIVFHDNLDECNLEPGIMSAFQSVLEQVVVRASGPKATDRIAIAPAAASASDIVESAAPTSLVTPAALAWLLLLPWLLLRPLRPRKLSPALLLLPWLFLLPWLLLLPWLIRLPWLLLQQWLLLLPWLFVLR